MRYLLLFSLTFFAVLSSFAQTDCSCCNADHRAFDFWVGEWRVTNPDGTYAGTNIITKEEDDCVLREQWTSATPGYTGTSMNYYDIVLKQWVQLWVDNQGQSLYMRGNLIDGAMVLQSEAVAGLDGTTRYHKVSWTPLSESKVRQHWETSTDGTTWVTVFDGLYAKN
ncbi:hypothetical protein [Gilvibacter sediminis]|uniref:hypothetical protein n=1 Tax=Gilvibacter sediminis TaxID=379071 RepID=UPI002350E641|nr:hypothetical protein [Gilvibacter sediminis]MDC7997808.1 hypothetical protein [Gilvibacter sediminis]